MSKMGNSNLRKALYISAISAKKHNPVVKAFCERLKQAVKPKMVILGAAMRKLLHLAYGIFLESLLMQVYSIPDKHF